jgi:hypothetical protein
MNYDTKSRRIKLGISLNLPIHYRNVWFARLNNIVQMIEHGLSYIEISKHYKCPVSALTAAMSYHDISSVDVRRKYSEKLKGHAL